MNKVSVKELVRQANERITTLTADEALKCASQGKTVFVDIRDIRELAKEGKVEGAIHAPRGMLEFWFDVDCKYHRDVFDQPDKTFVFFCAAGWRSALATRSIQEMGFDNIAHVDGGFAALKDAGATLVEPETT